LCFISLERYGLAVHNHPIVYFFYILFIVWKIIWLFVLAVEFTRLVQFLVFREAALSKHKISVLNIYLLDTLFRFTI
jgi:hypothetical protein